MQVGSFSPRRTIVWPSHVLVPCPTPFIRVRNVDPTGTFPLVLDRTKRSVAARNTSSISRSIAATQPSSYIEVSDNLKPNAFDPDALAKAAGVQCLVHCGPTPLGRGLVAPRSLDRQAIVSVPLQHALVITDEPLTGISVFGDRCHSLWQEHHGQLPQQLLDFLTGDARWDVRMTAWLLWVASELPDSPVWGSYLASLPPADEVTCLLNYGPDEARELQFKELVEEARSQHKWALTVHRSYFGSEGELRKLRLAMRIEDTMWAMSMVRTRTFSEDVNGEALTLMVPYADLANHSFQHNATFGMSRDNTRFELRLLLPLAAGEEATISYGEGKPNFEVMRDYGFIVPGNTNDRIKLPNQDTLPALNGASLLEALGIKGDWRNGGKLTRVHPETSPGGEPANLLALARQKSAVLSMNLSDGFPSPKGGASEAEREGEDLAARIGGGEAVGGVEAEPPSDVVLSLLCANFLRRESADKWPGATSWTDAGRPPPQRLNGSATTMTTERAAVATVRQSYQAALDELPTSIAKDESLLLAHDQASGGAAVPLPSRVAAAVRCRLEHKLLLAEAVRALEIYDIWLHERLRLGRLVG